MKKFNFTILFVLIGVLITNVNFLKTTYAQTNSFESIVPFSGGAGFVKFFDKATGKLYIYDRDMKFINSYELEEMGKSAL